MIFNETKKNDFLQTSIDQQWVSARTIETKTTSFYKSIFLEKSLHKFKTYLSLDLLMGIFNLFSFQINKTLNEVNSEELSEPHLVQLFNRLGIKPRNYGFFCKLLKLGVMQELGSGDGGVASATAVPPAVLSEA